MCIAKYTQITAALALALAAIAPATAATEATPWAQMETASLMVGIGGQSGDGVLNLPNLGTNCTYPFTIAGFGVGPHVGVSAIVASGPVTNLTRLEDFSGQYSASQGEGTVIAGAGAMSMKNNGNNVGIDFSSRTAGLGMGISGQGISVNMPVPPVNAPRVYVLEFGFNKELLNRENRAKLDEIVGAWKCRFVNIEVTGHTDTVGREDQNLDLSEMRANAVRDYLLGSGVVPTRVATSFAGESDQQVPTVNGVRLRANRAVVITIR